MKVIEMTGKTVDEALKHALDELKLTKDKVNVTVPGGKLRIEIEGTSIYMIGDAEFICSGEAY